MTEKSIVKKTKLFYQDEFSDSGQEWTFERRVISSKCPYNPLMKQKGFKGKIGDFLVIADGKGWWARDLGDGLFEYLHHDSDDEQEIGADDGLNFGHDEAQELINAHYERYYNK